MAKVNVSSNLSLIYRKLVNYGYLFVSTKYEKQKSLRASRGLYNKPWLKTFKLLLHIKLFVNQVSKNMIIRNIVHVHVYEFSTFTRRHNIVSFLKEICVKRLQTIIESVEY